MAGAMRGLLNLPDHFWLMVRFHHFPPKIEKTKWGDEPVNLDEGTLV